MNSAFITNIGIFFLSKLALLPFRIIYIISDCLYFVVYYIFGYRKDVVITNLKNSFPEKTDKEINTISRNFYRHLCDLILETIKMRWMDENDFKDRMVFKNPDTINKYFNQGQSIVVLTMHYNNWEWTSWVQVTIKHKILAVYKPLHNHIFDQYFNKIRRKLSLNLIPDSNILRTIIVANKNKEITATWLAADQTPPISQSFWMKFLNQETVFHPGPVAISKRFNFPVFFQKIKKTERGRYETEVEILFEDPDEKTEIEIMKAYISKMEKVIQEQPEFYLWSHKRWKRKRPENVPLHN